MFCNEWLKQQCRVDEFIFKKKSILGVFKAVLLKHLPLDKRAPYIFFILEKEKSKISAGFILIYRLSSGVRYH